MTTTTYVDTNLHHEKVTGRAVTACLHIMNATPTHWHTKRQGTVETGILYLNLCSQDWYRPNHGSQVHPNVSWSSSQSKNNMFGDNC